MAGTCACDGPYYGSSCGFHLTCGWWNGTGFPSSGCDAVDIVTDATDSSSSRLQCECTHLTLFEALYEIEWTNVELYEGMAMPVMSLPFSRWGELWSGLSSLHPIAYVLMASVLLTLTMLLLWARYQDRRTEYLAYMPQWYKGLRRVERAARNSPSLGVRACAWPLLLLLWFTTNHPWIVVFLVKPSDELKHAHLVRRPPL